ncbi:phosphopantetheine-binding protein [Streptomyces sp. 372A]
MSDFSAPRTSESSGVMNPPWDKQFESLIRRSLSLLEPDEPLLADLYTPDYGLDSLAMVELMLGIEDAYGISFPDDLVDPGIFTTPQGLWNVVSALCTAGTP